MTPRPCPSTTFCTCAIVEQTYCRAERVVRWTMRREREAESALMRQERQADMRPGRRNQTPADLAETEPRAGSSDPRAGAK